MRLSESQLRYERRQIDMSGRRTIACETVAAMVDELLELRAFRDAVMGWTDNGGDEDQAESRADEMSRAIARERQRLHGAGGDPK